MRQGQWLFFAVYDAGVPVFRRAAENYEVARARCSVGRLHSRRSALSLPFKVFSLLLKATFGHTTKDGERCFAKPS